MKIQGTPMPEPVGSPNGLSIRATGATGNVDSVSTTVSDTRAGQRAPTINAPQDLEKSGIFVIEQLSIDLELPPAAPAAVTRGVMPTPPSVFVPVRNEKASYAVNYVDDTTGAHIWVFAKEKSGSDLVFDLPPPTVPDAPPATSKDGTRGPITAAMRGLVTVVMWVTDKGVGGGVNAIAEAWENSKRPYGLHQVDANGKMVKPDWTIFNSEPVLLLVHGTFSTPEAGFAGWIDHPDFAAIHKHYGGRCLALAHPSMHTDPAENVDW